MALANESSARSTWAYSASAGMAAAGVDLVGFRVQATDGEVGRISEASCAIGDSYLVVEVGGWILGKRVMLPACMVARIDRDGCTVFVEGAIEQITGAPEFGPETHTVQYRDEVADYYRLGPDMTG